MTYTTDELNQTGIYCILNLDNGKRYIGSTARTFKERWGKHKLELRKGIHHSIHLQRSWIKHTEFRFEFKILEFVPPNYCLQREQWWMDLYGSYIEDYGYNLCPKAGSPSLGKSPSEETKKKIGDAHRGKFVSDETREKNRQAALGRKHSDAAKAKVGDYWRGRKRSEETKAKMSAHKKSEEHIKKVTQANKGKQRTVEQKLFMAKSKNPEGYNIISPDGELFHFYNMSDFCREYNLDTSHISRVLKGIDRSHKGWKAVDRKLPPITLSELREKGAFKLISPDGKLYEFTNIQQFCKNNKLTRSSIMSVLKGQASNHKGWRKVS